MKLTNLKQVKYRKQMFQTKKQPNWLASWVKDLKISY